jgi:WD40 repeat protein
LDRDEGAGEGPRASLRDSKCAGVIFAQFSPDGLRVVTGSEGKTAQVRNAKTGQPLTEPLMHPAPVFAQFSPDSQRVVTVSEDNTARIWHVPIVPLPVPLAVGELVESLAGQRLNDQGVLEPVDGSQIQTLQNQLSSSMQPVNPELCLHRAECWNRSTAPMMRIGR